MFGSYFLYLLVGNIIMYLGGFLPMFYTVHVIVMMISS